VKQKLEIVGETADYVLVNKPAGMLSIPDRAQSVPSLRDMLLLQMDAVFTVHRLDRDTSGLLLFAKNEEAHRYYSQLFEKREVEKYYVGIVLGKPATETSIIDASITEHLTEKGKMVVHRQGKSSQTGYEFLEGNHRYSLMKFRLYTGRTHQIRVHCKHIGHPLACDPLYGDGKPLLLSEIKKKYKLSQHELEERPVLDRLALHAYRLRFTDQQGIIQEAEAPLPKAFTAWMTQLAKSGQ
jgi:23S rRNA pseudouridine955/2504/2580 synthase/23S rRNA pseudouridine1911/1915/1917 synthase